MSEQDAPTDEAAAGDDADRPEGADDEGEERGDEPTDRTRQAGDGSDGAGDEAEVAAAEAGDGAADPTEAGDGAATTVDDELLARVRDADPEELAREVGALRDRVDALEDELAESEAEREELESKLKRKQADFRNFKKRQEKRREEAERRATEDVVERLLDVRDNLDRALDQEAGVDIRDGVETTRRQFDRVLGAEGVEAIAPDPGAEVDPQRHEVLMRVESDREPGTVDEVHRPGYEMAGKVLRPAQVTVAED